MMNVIDGRRLPIEVDNNTVIFSYGSLLDHSKLRELLVSRGTFEIFETNSLADAAGLVQAHKHDIVILRNVELADVRVSIVTELILRRWYADRGGSVAELFEEEITSEEAAENVYLYARPARIGERGKTLNGGLICNLTEADTLTLDRYEMIPVLVRTRAPKLTIDGVSYQPRHVFFYAGTESAADITSAERAEMIRLFNLNRERGKLGPQAKWPVDVRKKA